MSFLRRSLSWGLLLAGLGAGCVDPYDARLNFNTNLITVEGTLTDQAGPQVVRLRRAVSTRTTSTSQFLRNAAVEVIVNDQTRFQLTEQAPGDYVLPGSFRGVPGATYQLRFRLADGTSYESTPERMPAPKPIQNVYDQFDREAIEARSTGSTPLFQPGHRVYLDTQDPANQPDFYQWMWRLWENQPICATCQQGLYQLGRGCEIDRSLPSGNLFDYDCERRCWQILRSARLNVMNDLYSDGRVIKGRQVAIIPLHMRSGALLEISQLALTSGAFRYFKLLADQIQNTGSLADTPPASIFGNVRNATNPNDRAVGYFAAAAVSQARHWLSREDTPPDARPIGLLGGREIQREPSDPRTLRPPLAPCTPSDFQTPTRPEGWRGN